MQGRLSRLYIIQILPGWTRRAVIDDLQIDSIQSSHIVVVREGPGPWAPEITPKDHR